MESPSSLFRAAREKAGFTIDEAARYLDMSPRTIRRKEKGESKVRRAEIAQLKAAPRRSRDFGSSEFTFIDLFAGIGGLRMGFESIGGRCVFTSEWDKYAQQTYGVNFPRDNHGIAGDIRLVDESSIPDHDLLLAGFPCQPFSIAGVSKKNALNKPHGFRDETQGTLFFDVARIIAHHRPRAFVLENVRNLKNHDKGRTFRIIMETLRNELGYESVESYLVNAKSWVPQHRERVFIVGFRKDVGFSFSEFKTPDWINGPRLRKILHSEDGTERDKLDEHRYITHQTGKVQPKYILSDHLWNYLQEYARKHKAKGNGFGFGLVGPGDIARTLSARYYKDGSEILIKRRRGNPRRLTPRECARLMGFKDTFKIPVSDAQAYRQFGNSVVVPVARAIAEHTRDWLMESMRKRPRVVSRG